MVGVFQSRGGSFGLGGISSSGHSSTEGGAMPSNSRSESVREFLYLRIASPNSIPASALLIIHASLRPSPRKNMLQYFAMGIVGLLEKRRSGAPSLLTYCHVLSTTMESDGTCPS